MPTIDYWRQHTALMHKIKLNHQALSRGEYHKVKSDATQAVQGSDNTYHEILDLQGQYAGHAMRDAAIRRRYQQYEVNIELATDYIDTYLRQLKVIADRKNFPDAGLVEAVKDAEDPDFVLPSSITESTAPAADPAVPKSKYDVTRAFDINGYKSDPDKAGTNMLAEALLKAIKIDHKMVQDIVAALPGNKVLVVLADPEDDDDD